MSASICRAAGRMSISSASTPRARISRQALPLVSSPVAKPGMVKPRIVERGSPIRSQAFAATISAWVESRPPETPITMCEPEVASNRRTSALTWMLKLS